MTSALRAPLPLLATLALTLALAPASAADRLIAPAVGESVPTGIGLATYCVGDPTTATWRAWSETLPGDEVRNGPDGSNSCYLPWLGPAPDILRPYSDATGYVDLNLRGMWCDEAPTPAELEAFEHPRFLYVKLPPEPNPMSGRGYRISVRILQGTAFPMSTEETQDARWPQWRKLRSGKLGADGEVLSIPFAELKVGEPYWFQVQLYLLNRNRTYAQRVVDFVAPIDC